MKYSDQKKPGLYSRFMENFNLYSRFGLIAIKDKTSGKWGFMNINFKLIIPYSYDEVENFNVFGHASVILNGRCGIINKENKFILFKHKNTNVLQFFTYEN